MHCPPRLAPRIALRIAPRIAQRIAQRVALVPLLLTTRRVSTRNVSTL